MKVLPITKPTIDSLPQHSYILSILEAKIKINEIVFNNFIQLKLDEYKNVVVILDYCENDFLNSPYLKESYSIYRKELTKNITEFLIERINNEYYVFLFVDEYYIPFSKAYEQYPMGHGIMVYGYNNLDNTFNVVGYNNFGKVITTTVSYNAIQDGYEKIVELFEEYQEDYLRKLFVLKPTLINSTKDTNLLLRSLNEYLHSKNTIKSYAQDYNMNCNTYFGLEIYDLLIKYLSVDGMTRSIIKNFYVLYEHKKIMSIRLNDLNNDYDLEGNEVMSLYKAIEDSVRLALNLLIKYEITQNELFITKIINILNDVKSMEKSAICKIINILH